jgi:calcineurin-like phosphoesterase family protein
MAVFFTSDTHFGHAGTLGLFGRPFASVAAMDDALVARWNAVVGADDEVWLLGDFALGPGLKRAAALLDALAGRKHLVAGNNDPPEVRALAGWASIADYAELELDGRALVLCHYPFRSWNADPPDRCRRRLLGFRAGRPAAPAGGGAAAAARAGAQMIRTDRNTRAAPSR